MRFARAMLQTPREVEAAMLKMVSVEVTGHVLTVVLSMLASQAS